MGGSGLRTLMRHFLGAAATAVLAHRMDHTAPVAALITPSCGPYRLAPGLLRTARTTVDVAPVATPANEHLSAATGAVEQTGGILHRRLLPMRTGLVTPSWRYCLSGRASHGLGVRYRTDLPVRAGAAPVSTALTVYTQSPRFATSLRLPATPSGLAVTVYRPPAAFTTLDGDKRRYSPTMRTFQPPSTMPVSPSPPATSARATRRGGWSPAWAM